MSDENQHMAKTASHESEEELFRRWDLPDVTITPLHEQERALNIRREGVVVDEPEEMPETLTMTAEALEEIRQAAYEEGFEQGHKDGFAKGHPEGVDAGHKEGLEQGLLEGREQGLAQGEAEIAEKAASLEALMRALHEPQQQIDDQVERELIGLTAQLAQAVLHHELQTNQQIILNTLREALGLLPFQQQTIRVQLNPSDLELVQQLYSDDQIEQRGWLLEAEPTLAIGDLRLLTEKSDVTVTMQERQQKVMQQFLAQLKPETKSESKPSELPDEPVAES